jgi:hypothetical protein
MTFKIAIRNVRARDEQDTLRYRATQPCDARKELANMNLVWTPQTNVSFDLISSEDVTIDHDDKSTQEDLRKAYGLKETSAAVFGHAAPEILAEKNWEVFANRKIPGADITFFVVNQVRSKGRSVAGVMNANLGISFIAGQHFPTIFAHEAGHFLGRYMNNGEWNPLDHQADTVDKRRDLRMLARRRFGLDDPVQLVKKSENFPTNRRPIREACLPLVISERQIGPSRQQRVTQSRSRSTVTGRSPEGLLSAQNGSPRSRTRASAQRRNRTSTRPRSGFRARPTRELHDRAAGRAAPLGNDTALGAVLSVRSLDRERSDLAEYVAIFRMVAEPAHFDRHRRMSVVAISSTC